MQKMKYKSDVAEKNWVLIKDFRLLPGSTVYIRHRGSLHYGTVNEVGSANPEYVFGGPHVKGAGTTVWKNTKKRRRECKKFFSGSHGKFPIKLQRSMWVTIVFTGVTHKRTCDVGYAFETGEIRRQLYTYEIEDLLGKGDLTVAKK